MRKFRTVGVSHINITESVLHTPKPSTHCLQYLQFQLFPESDKKVEYLSRFGRALKANHFSAEKTGKSSASPAKVPPRILTQEEIEAKVASVAERLAQQANPTAGSDRKESPSFRSISREQRSKLEKLTNLETPSPVHYNPQFSFIQRRSASTKLVATRTLPKTKQVPLPSCADEATLDCTRTEKRRLHGPAMQRTPKGVAEYQYDSLLLLREERRSAPDPPRMHIPTITFQKQLKRAGIPLNPHYESHYESPTAQARVSGPSFEKTLPRPEIFDLPTTVGGVYDYDIAKVMHRTDTGAVKFEKMSPRGVQPAKDTLLVESPDLQRLDAALSVVKPRTHIPSPDIARTSPRENAWIARESPRRKSPITAGMEITIARRSVGRTRK